MARICIVGTHPLGSNPRLVRNADSLAAAGHAVTVVYPDHLARFRRHDGAIIARAGWQAQPLDFCLSPLARLRWQFARVRHHLAAKAVRRHPSAFWLSRAYGYFTPELTAAAARTHADLYLAQTQTTLHAAATAAARTGGRYAIDVEDLLADCDTEPVELISRLEQLHYQGAAFLCTMSAAAADRLATLHRLARPPLVLHNCPPLAERGRLTPPEQRPAGTPISLYWFGQTIGPHSCAENILRALPSLRQPSRLVLRGHSSLPGYITGLRALATELGIPERLQIQPAAAPDKMVPLAGEHAICFGTQPSRQLFHQLAIGNKVFAGMSAGCAVALSDTTAHQRLLAAYPGWGFLYPEGDCSALASRLNDLCTTPGKLPSVRRAAWDLAGSTLNWENESRRLISAVAELTNP